MSTQFYLLASLLALLIGVAAGKAWERYKLRDGRWIDRRRLRDTPHYMLGLNFLTEHQVDQAIDELTQAASTDADALEIQMILGNLFRGKGQVSRAIAVHQALLQRPSLTRLEHAYVLLCLGLDFRHAGFVDRALEAFQEVLVLDPGNRYALTHLQKLHEEQHQWRDALRVREQIATGAGGNAGENAAILAFLRNEIGVEQQRIGDLKAAARTFEAAIDAYASTAPARLNLGDVREQLGDVPGALQAWEALVDVSSERAYLAFDRLERGYRATGADARFVDLCERLIRKHPGDWRARTALARHLLQGGQPRMAFDRLIEALPHHPHGLAVHQEIWHALADLDLDPALVSRYVSLARDAVFYLDPHICTSCRYRSTELLWLCPQCHTWNSFVEERIAPAKQLGE